MSRSTVVWLLVLAALALAVYIFYAHRKLPGGPDLSEGIGVVIAVVGLGGAARILYLVFWDQPDSMGNDDLVCLFVGAIAVGWCSVTAGVKPFKSETSGQSASAAISSSDHT